MTLKVISEGVESFDSPITSWLGKGGRIYQRRINFFGKL